MKLPWCDNFGCNAKYRLVLSAYDIFLANSLFITTLSPVNITGNTRFVQNGHISLSSLILVGILIFSLSVININNIA
jgi:hypothetical protein